MRRPAPLLFGLALVLALAAHLAGEDRPKASIASLGFLAGLWQGPMWGGEFAAYYTTTEGGKVLSYSELRKGGKAVFHEFEVFEERDGAVVYTPYPGGTRKPAFRLAEAAADRAVFENPDKDYPTRVVFERAGDALTITLTDPHGGSDKVERFALKRAP